MHHGQLAEIEVRLREVRDAEQRTKLQAEQRAIAAAGGAKNLGSNEDERKRALALAVLEDADYRMVVAQFRQVEAEHARMLAKLETWKDERRATEWEIRSRLADAVRGIGEMTATPDDRATFDQALDAVASRLLTALLARVVAQIPALEEPPF